MSPSIDPFVVPLFIKPKADEFAAGNVDRLI
jgi:hypothetical protein